MKSHIKKSILVLIGSLFLMVAFQNCGQAGSVTENAPDFSKITDPLVVDVVNEIENQEIQEQEQIKEEIAKEEDKPEEVVADEVKEIVVAEEEKKEEAVVAEEEKKEEVVADEVKQVIVDDSKEETQIVVVDDSVENEQPATPIEQVLEDYSCDDNKGKANEKKVLVCHYPPGNAAARHEICISKNALKAHQSHGHSSADHQDHLGKCVAGQ